MIIVQKEIKLKCNNCGKEFVSEFYEGGSIDHDNYTNDWNMNVFVNRFNNGDNYYTHDELFKDSITLVGNLCNIKNNDYKIGIEIFECRIIWLKKYGYDKIAEYLESRRNDIKAEFNKIIYQQIEEKEKEIEYLSKKIM